MSEDPRQPNPSTQSESASERPQALAEPVKLQERVTSVDTLRGFALLGILAMNIYFFALPSATMFNPTVAGGFEGANKIVWLATYLFFNQKFMALFSMLFGAGLVLMYRRAEASGRRLGKTYYRRLFFLLLFGLIHAYFIWMGDILVWYALAGIWLFPLRKLGAKSLLTIGFVVLMIGVPVNAGLGLGLEFLKGGAETAIEAQKAGRTLSPQEQSLLESWEGTRSTMMPNEEDLSRDFAVHRGGYWELVKHRAPQLLSSQLFGGIAFGWRIVGLMIMGMGFMKLRLFSASRKKLTYIVLMIVGYGIAMPISGLGAGQLMSRDFDLMYTFQMGMMYDYIASVFVALGHIGLVMLICQSGILTWLRERLTAVGRMAFTNYLMQSLICTLIFYGYGLGLYGKVERLELQYFTLSIWILQLLWSKWWLARFKMGPFEWLWRTLTYGRRPEFRIRDIGTAS